MYKIDIPESLLRKMYVEQEMTSHEIAAHFGCDVGTICNRLHAYGIPVYPSGPRRVVLTYEELYERYVNQKQSAASIAAHFGCAKAIVLKNLRKHGIPIRPAKRPREYVPPQVYAAWTPDLAYAVGLFTADGHLSKSSNEILMTSSEIEVLDLFAGCLQLDTDLEPHEKKVSGNQKPAYALYFSDLDFRAFLERIGLTPAKSLTIGPLDVPDDVFADFARGCWDGDGCWHICRSTPPYEYLYSDLCSCGPDFLQWMQVTIERFTGLPGCLTGVRIKYGGSKAVALGRWMYYAPNVPALSRKRAIWERFAPKPCYPVQTAVQSRADD